MSAVVWRAVAIGPGGMGDEQRYATNRRFFQETSTPWIRLWADWAVAQPRRDAPPDLRRLDADVAGARADGLRVIVTAWRHPRWTNGTDALTDDEERTFELEDRMAPGADPIARKDPTFRLPDDLSPESDWGRWIDLLIYRYSDAIDALEITNEPNLQLWPQRDVADATARMMVTAQTIAARHLAPPLLIAPATADVAAAPGSRLRTPFEQFTSDLLDRLDEHGFTPGPRFAWSHHSYIDVETDTAAGTAAARAQLVSRWAGWPVADPAAPGLLITETGARINRVGSDPAAARQRQAELIERYFRRMQFGAEGDGVGLVCLYPFVTDLNYDSGLCELDGTPRPAYYAWGRLPSFS